MSEYRIRSTGEVKTQGQIRSDNPNSSLPKVWGANVHEALGIDPVLAAPKPAPSGDYKIVVRDGVEQDANGNWVQAWAEREMFTEYTEELTDQDGVTTTVTHTVQDQIDAKVAADNAALEAVERAKRNTLLAETDWISIKALESGQAPSAEMVAYRQALRDVPSQAGFPGEITWPTKPE